MSKQRVMATVFALWTAAAASSAAAVQEASGVEVAFDTQFDRQGRVLELRPHLESEHSAAFWDGLRSRLSGLKVPPALDASGQPATLRTGLHVTVDVVGDSATGQAKLVGLDVRPLVLKEEYAPYPGEIMRAAAGWSGSVTAECVVNRDGRCGPVKVRANPSLPPGVLRWAVDSLALWQFQPPQINGEPIEVPIQQVLTLAMPDKLPVKFLQRGSGNAPLRQ